VTNGKNKESGIVFPFGGFGLTFSKGSIARLLRPLSRSNAIANDEWHNSTLSAIDKNLIIERETFRDGMNVAKMMEQFAMAEPFHKTSNWTRGYCFHGDWALAIFTQLYGLHSSYYMDTLQNSHITLKGSKQGPRSTGLCLNEYEHCKSSDLVCHYQTPSAMKRLIFKATKQADTVYDMPNVTFSSSNGTVDDGSPIVF
jgi:hypothetical protein